VEAPILEISRIRPLVGLRLSGELDLFTSPQLAAVLADIGGDRPVHIDLSELTFIDSSGIREILTFAGSRSGRGRVVLINPSKPVRRAMEIVGLEQHPAVEILLRASSTRSRCAVGVGQTSPIEEA
jgi:anti-sigma B factor antagonist